MGFISDLIGATNNFKATKPAGPDYQAAIQKALNGLTGGSSNQARQDGLAENLTNAVNGQGPSVAASTLQAATDQNIQGLAGQIASAKGVNPALAARALASGGAMAGQTAANQAATLRAQEILGARDQLGNLVSTGRAQDIGQLGTLGGLQGQQQQIDLGSQQINAGVAAENAKTNAGVAGGILGGVAKLGAAAMADGGKVPGEAPVEGDSPANDTVPTMLSPGEGVLPRSVMDDPEQAADFARELVARGRAKKPAEDKKKASEGEPAGYAKVAKALKKIEDRMKKLEA